VGAGLAGAGLGGGRRRGTGHLLAQQLLAAGERVLDVPPKLAARVRLLATGNINKNDPNDARSVAVAALRSAGVREVRRDDHAAVRKVWSKRYQDLGRARTQVPSRLDATDLARLRANGAVPAGAPPLPAPSGGIIEIDRTVNASGNISVGNHVIGAGSPLAGRRVTVRLDGPVAHILADGNAVRTIACPVPQPARRRLRGARAGTDRPPQLPAPLTVWRRVSIRGAIMIGGQRIQVGLPHAGQTAEITIGSDTYQITVEDGTALTAPRTTSRDVKRHKASTYPDRGGHDGQC
jgi:hypothetical protein